MNAAMVIAIAAALAPSATLPATASAGCCGGSSQPERVSLVLDVLVNMRGRLAPGIITDDDVGWYAIGVTTPHLCAGAPLDACFWDLSRTTKHVTEAEVRLNYDGVIAV